jgi:regulator of protease activity HflC (stomatin/prohibitin superfamily)
MFDTAKNPINIKPPSSVRPVIFVVLAVFVASLFFSSYFTVDQGERGIVLRFGAFQRIAEPGLNFKIPFLESTHTISLQTQVSHFQLPAYSRDQQPANLAVSINWHAQESELQKI